MDFDVLALIAAMTWTAVAFMKHLRAKAYGDAITIAVIIVVATLVAWLVQAAGKGLGDENFAGLILVGYGATSALRAVYEFKKALDGSDSAAEPKLMPPSA